VFDFTNITSIKGEVNMKRLFSKTLNTLPKRLFAASLIALAVAFPAASLAADTVAIEGSLGVANVTRGDTQYQHAVNASYDQVVKLQVYYHNRELPDSGKVAQNLRVKINIPTTAGQTQNVSTVIRADNSNTVTDQASVNLDRGDAYLQYIPGSAVWKHNTGTNSDLKIVETNVSDNIVYSDQGLVLENEKPCYNFAATVTVLARVMVPGVKITKQVEKASQNNAWTTSNTAESGDTLKYLISYTNTGNSVQNQVVIRDNLPPKMTLVPGTTFLADASHPGGVKVGDTVNQGGISAGNFGAGANAFVTFEVKVPDASQLACGVTEFRNVGVVRPAGMNEYYNTAITTVNRACNSNAPKFTCDLLDLSVDNTKRTVKVSDFKFTAQNGAEFNHVVLTWGDNSEALTTNNVVGQTHQYANDGTFVVNAVAHFTVNGEDVSASGSSCSKTVSFTSTVPPTPGQPTSLVNTGPGEVAGLFAAITAFGAVAYRTLLVRRTARK
jgi:uncharacterized repeat protein (TIGR01451 family)